MVSHVPVALEFCNAMVVIIVRIDVLAVNIRVPHEDTLVFVRTHRVLGHAVGNAQIRRTVREIVITLILVDVRGFHRLRAANLQFRLGTGIKALHILVELVNIEDIVVIVPSRASIAIATAKCKVARAVVIEENRRVKAPANAVAVGNATAPVVDEFLVARDRVCPRSCNTVGPDEADTAATAIREHNVKSVVIRVHRNARRPDIANAIDLAGIVNDTEVCPVLHILGAETVKGLDIIAIGIRCSRVIRVGYDIEISIIGSGTRVRQIVVTRNWVVCKRAHTKARQQARHR